MSTTTQVTAEWVTGDAPNDLSGQHAIFMGGDPTNPTWEEYRAEFKDEYQPYIDAVRECIERNGWVGRSGSEMCNYGHFRFNDGQTLTLTWRAWGDLMQAIVGKREGYMAYYM
jgi:poly-D-alanine transfer protein DltD